MFDTNKYLLTVNTFKEVAILILDWMRTCCLSPQLPVNCLQSQNHVYQWWLNLLAMLENHSRCSVANHTLNLEQDLRFSEGKRFKMATCPWEKTRRFTLSLFKNGERVLTRPVLVPRLSIKWLISDGSLLRAAAEVAMGDISIGN